MNAQGEDVVAGIRNTEPLSALEGPVPQDLRASSWPSSPGSSATTATCATPSSPSSRASSGCCRPGSGKRTGRAALRMAVEMTTDAGIRLTHGRGGAAGHRRAPRAGPPSAVRRLGPRRAHQGSGRVARVRPSVGPTSPPTTPPPPPSGASGSSSCAARPRPRTCTACSPPRGSSPPGVASCRTPRSWPGAGASRPSWGRRRCAFGDRSSGGGHHGRRGRLALDRRDRRARSCWARWRWPRPRRPRSSTRCSGGPTTSARAIWRCGPTPTTVPTPPTAGGSGAEGIGLCRTEHMFLAEDRLPIVRRMILAAHSDEENRRPGGAPRGPAGRLRRDPRGHGRPAR